MQLLDVQHSIVGNVERRGISGGQRKRVNIGLLPLDDDDDDDDVHGFSATVIAVMAVIKMKQDQEDNDYKNYYDESHCMAITSSTLLTMICSVPDDFHLWFATALNSQS